MAADDARVRADDDGLLHGLGFFETFRTRASRPHLWALHRARLDAGCRVAGIVLPAVFLARDEAKLHRCIREMLAAARLTDGVFRYTLTAGPRDALNASFLEPSELLTVRSVPPAAPNEGVALRVLTLRRDNGEWLPRPKSLNFANALLGERELQRRASTLHDEGLFLTREGGHIVEAVRHNLIWLTDGHACYPDPTLGAVAGTGLEWARGIQRDMQPRRASLHELRRADAVMLINSVRGITPVAELWSEDDQTRLGVFRSHAHPLVGDLRASWDEALRATANAIGASETGCDVA